MKPIEKPLLDECVRLLAQSSEEINNLRRKIWNKETHEGWEGCRARDVLEIETMKLLARLETERKKLTDGDGI